MQYLAHSWCSLKGRFENTHTTHLNSSQSCPRPPGLSWPSLPLSVCVLILSLAQSRDMLRKASLLQENSSILLQDQILMVFGLSSIYLSLLPFISGANGDMIIFHLVNQNLFVSSNPTVARRCCVFMISFGSPNLEKDSKRVVEGNLRGHSPSQDVVFGDRITREPPYPPHTGSLTPSGRGSKGRERFLSCLHPGLLPGDFDHLLPALSWDSGLRAHVSDSARAAWCSVSKSFANCRGRVCFFLLAMKRKNFLVCPPLSLPQPILHKQNKINKHLY